ncbi:MAG TPA: hypothetical protein VEY30_04545 [Myxococcaceae bacterium]|nr:hypothetical protein [Myxococcaceae bacterium]
MAARALRTLCFLSCLTGLACERTAPSAPVTRAEDVQRETDEALSATARYAAGQKEEFERRVRTQLAEIDRRIAELRKQTGQGAEQRLADLQAQRRTVDERLSQAQASMGTAWEKLKAGVEGAVEELDKGVRAGEPHRRNIPPQN